MNRLETREIVRANLNLFFNLYERWQCEREYEDIQDYLEVFQKSFPTAYKISKRPFGIFCKCDDGDINVLVKRNGNIIEVKSRYI